MFMSLFCASLWAQCVVKSRKLRADDTVTFPYVVLRAGKRGRSVGRRSSVVGRNGRNVVDARKPDGLRSRPALWFPLWPTVC